MARYFTPNKLPLLAIIFIVFLNACNNASDKKTESEKDTTISNVPFAGITAGKMDSLFIDSASFARLPDTSKLVFIFTFRTNDTITLHGWVAQKDTLFTPDPDIKLKEYAADTTSYGPGMYFGNLVLKKAEVKNIQKLLRTTHSHSVLFAPQLIDHTHVGYKVFVSSESPDHEKVLTVTGTGASLNPSPPKGY